MKKMLSKSFILLMILLTITSCGTKEQKGTIDDILYKVYAPVGEKCPKVSQTKLTAENLLYHLGLESLDFEEGIISEPATNKSSHSVVIVRVKDGVDIEKTKQEIKENINQTKWIENQTSSVIVESKDNVIILIMLEDNDIANKMQETFKNLD